MKRPPLLLGLAAALPGVAQAQLPIAPPVDPAPASSIPAPAPPAKADEPTAGPVPGPQYFMDPVAPATTPAPPAPATEPPAFEPPLPAGVLFEPPPPPPDGEHLAPSTALWLGVRLGWFIPFGNVWARATPVSTAAGAGYTLQGVPWRDYASSGPMFELDAGLRLSRAYTVFALWERAELGSGSATTDGSPSGAESDFWALALRASSNPDQLGFVSEVAIGYRRARSFYEDGVEVQFTDAPFEARLGIGAELRLNRITSLSSLITIGVGGFGTVDKVLPDGRAVPKLLPSDEGDGHGWVTLSLGGHFDLFASKR